MIFLKGNEMMGVVCSALRLAHLEPSVTEAALAAIPESHLLRKKHVAKNRL